MRSTIGVFVLALAIGCGNLGGGGNNGGNGGSGGGGNGGTGGGTGGTGGGGTGGGAGGGAGGGGAGGGGAGGGGAGGSGGTPDYASGTRIKARTLSSADGAKAFAGFYDTQLSIPCAFNRAGDDTVRCLPTNIFYVSPWFGDSGCTMPLAYSTTGCTSIYAQKSETANNCVDVGYYSTGARSRIYSVGAAFSGAMVWVGAQCTMTTPPAGYTLYQLGSEVPASNFAAGSVDIAP